ncbi:MAG: ACP S-malonyltransferase [Syntrophobacteraceae bacterium]
MRTAAFLFPGQGAQVIGMGRSIAERFPESMELLDRAESKLGMNLRRLMFEGPQAKLDEDFRAQAAVYLASCMVVDLLESRGIRAGAIAPYSSGLYAAAYAAGVLDFETGLSLMVEADRCIREVGPAGAMGVILGLSGPEVDRLRDGITGWAEVSIVNTRHQTIVSGDPRGVDEILQRAKLAEALKTDVLSASAPYHCSLLKPADSKLAQTVSKTPLNDPHTPVVSYIDCQAVTRSDEMAGLLSNQLANPVNWVGVVEELVRRGLTPFVEIGPSQMLGRSVRWIHRPATVLYTDTADTLVRTIEALLNP